MNDTKEEYDIKDYRITNGKKDNNIFKGYLKNSLIYMSFYLVVLLINLINKNKLEISLSSIGTWLVTWLSISAIQKESNIDITVKDSKNVTKLNDEQIETAFNKAKEHIKNNTYGDELVLQIYNIYRVDSIKEDKNNQLNISLLTCIISIMIYSCLSIIDSIKYSANMIPAICMMLYVLGSKIKNNKNTDDNKFKYILKKELNLEVEKNNRIKKEEDIHGKKER